MTCKQPATEVAGFLVDAISIPDNPLLNNCLSHGRFGQAIPLAIEIASFLAAVL